MGKYAINFVWNDGHQHGIYTWSYLRQICPCPECKMKRESTDGTWPSTTAASRIDALNLSRDVNLGFSFKSRSQVARVRTESWCARELYSPSCGYESLDSAPTNSPVFDST